MLRSRASQILVFTSSHFKRGRGGDDAGTSDSEMVKDYKRYGILMAVSFLVKDRGPLFTSKVK